MIIHYVKELPYPKVFDLYIGAVVMLLKNNIVEVSLSSLEVKDTFLFQIA